MGCPLCADFCRELRFEGSRDLDLFLASAAGAVRERHLAIDSGGLAWDDYIECDLHCSACNQRFELRCETYHGRGGAWRPV
jgi:hypothetical protein